MPLDAVMLSSVKRELESRITGMKIDKVFQPEKDEIILALRGAGGTCRLLLSASPVNGRIHIASKNKENPQSPPMFCMLLRKNLVGGIIRGISQPPLERLLRIDIDAPDEIGWTQQRTLILELLGRQSNIMLLDEDNRIIESIRRIDTDVSGRRAVLPGLFYRPPEPQDKLSPLDDGAPALLDTAPEGAQCDRYLIDCFSGLSPLICRETAYIACSDTSPRFGELNALQRTRFKESFEWLVCEIRSGGKPYMLMSGGAPKDISYIPIKQYGPSCTLVTYPGFSELIEDYFDERDRSERLRQRSQDITRTVSTSLERTRRKLENQRRELEAAKNREHLRQYGDLLMANLHQIKRGMSAVTVTNFYDPEGAETVIPLEAQLSGQESAAKYYKDYSRMKNAEKILVELIDKGENEVNYLESVLYETTKAEGERDLLEIREELTETGYLRRRGDPRRKKQTLGRPREFVTPTGFVILAGRNNLQNDILTFKTAAKGDIWLHARNAPGSHVVIRCEGLEPDDATYTAAAGIAAFYSGLHDGNNVPIDYTRIKHIKKPPGARPGMVIYNTYYTMYVTPDETKLAKLRK